MTGLQIEYRKYQETVQHNRNTEEQARQELAEQKRHSYVSETETQRSNEANEAIKRQQNMINAAHYSRMDRETAQHNRNTEKIAAFEAITKAKQVMVNARDLDLKAKELGIASQEADIKQQQADTQHLNTVLDYLIDARKVTVQEKQLGINQGELDLHKLTTQSTVDLNTQKIKESKTASFRNTTSGINNLTNSAVDVTRILLNAGPTNVTDVIKKNVRSMIPGIPSTGNLGQR